MDTIKHIFLAFPMLLFIASGFAVLVGFFFVIVYVLIAITLKLIKQNVGTSKIIGTTPTNLPKYRKLVNMSYIIIPITGILIWPFFLLNFWYQDGAMLYYAAFFVCILIFFLEMSVFWAIWQWRNFKWVGLIPLFLSICFLIIIHHPISIENRIIALRLEHNLPQNNQFIEKIQIGKVEKDNYGWIKIPESFPAARVSEIRTETGELQVLFMTGGVGMGAPAHWGYMYLANEKTSQEHKWKNRKIKPHWYWYSD